jgi:hypothetical protein
MNRSAGRPAEHRRAVLDQAVAELVRQEPCLAPTAIDDLMTSAPASESRCVVTTSDRAGRLADRSSVRCMGWAPHTSVSFDLRDDMIAVVRATGSTSSITTQGHLRLPVAIRRRSRINAGSRLLVVAWPRRGTLVLCTSHYVENMLLTRMYGTGGLVRRSS